MSDHRQRPLDSKGPPKGPTPDARPEAAGTPEQRSSSGELTLAYTGKVHVAPMPNASTEHVQPAVMLRGSLLDESEVLSADAPRDLEVWVPGGKANEPKRNVARAPLTLERGRAAGPEAPMPAGMFQPSGAKGLAMTPDPTNPATPAAKGLTPGMPFAPPIPSSAPIPTFSLPPAVPRKDGRRGLAITLILLLLLVIAVLGVISLLRFVDVGALLHRS